MYLMYTMKYELCIVYMHMYNKRTTHRLYIHYKYVFFYYYVPPIYIFSGFFPVKRHSILMNKLILKGFAAQKPYKSTVFSKKFSQRTFFMEILLGS